MIMIEFNQDQQKLRLFHPKYSTYKKPGYYIYSNEKLQGISTNGISKKTNRI